MKKQEIIYAELQRHTLHQLSTRRMPIFVLTTIFSYVVFLSKTAMDYLPLDTTKDMTHSFEKQR
jgi:hypothetical protein